MNKKTILSLLIVLIIFPYMNACVPVQEKAYVKEGKQYGVTEGMFRGRWWSLYERGVSFGDGDFLNEAESDFRAAIRQRSPDQRMARTYGMHFVDYFPHRELGIIFYKKNLFQEAIDALEFSISSEESAKAKFYLNKARIALLRTQDRQDTTPPQVLITTEEKNRATNRFSIIVSGEASDDNFVSAVTINGVPEFVELSEKTIRFEKEINLLPGSNQITVTARDLLGNTGKKTFEVTADYQGPNLSVLNYVDNQQVDRRDIRVEIAYHDESGMEYVSLAGEKIYPGKENNGTLSADIHLENGMNHIVMEARDNAGNKTIGRLSIVYYPGRLVAANTFSGASESDPPQATDAMVIAGNTKSVDPLPPEISFKGLLKTLSDNEPLTVTGRKNNNHIFIEGQASDSAGIEEILINGVPLSIRQGKLIVFNKLMEFNEGENQFDITARNTDGTASIKSVTVIRRIPQIDLDESKMILSIMPFKTSTISRELADSIYNLFLQEMVNSKRFNLVERGPDFEAVLKELKLSQTDLVDREKAVQTGKLLASEAVLIGDIIEKENEVEIYAKLVNVETSEYITVQDVYGQDKSRNRIEHLVAGLTSEIIYSVPLIEGRILAVKGKEYYLDMGNEKHFNLKKGVKCLAFRSTPFVVDGVNLGDEISVLGTLVINQVNPKFSIAAMHGKENIDTRIDLEIQKSDNVITK